MVKKKEPPFQFRVGVLGATGYIGAPYRAELRADPSVTIVALSARRAELLAEAGREDGAALLTSDWRSVVERPDVNLIIIATPDAMHYEPLLACAAIGKHVVCEKPIGKNAEQAREMWEAFADLPFGHFVPFWTRYAPLVRRAREEIQAGVVGPIRSMIYRWHNPRPRKMPFTWRDDAEFSSAGSIADVGSHAYDTMRWIAGQDAIRVQADAAVLAGPKPDLGEVNLQEALDHGLAASSDDNSAETRPAARIGTAYDYASIAFELEEGIRGTLMLSHAWFLRKNLAPDIEVHGETGSLAVHRGRGELILCRDDQQPQLVATIPDPPEVNRFTQFVLPALRKVIQGEQSDHPSLLDGLRAQQFTDAAARSAATGRRIDLAPQRAPAL